MKGLNAFIGYCADRMEIKDGTAKVVAISIADSGHVLVTLSGVSPDPRTDEEVEVCRTARFYPSHGSWFETIEQWYARASRQVQMRPLIEVLNGLEMQLMDEATK